LCFREATDKLGELGDPRTLGLDYPKCKGGKLPKIIARIRQKGRREMI